MGQCQPTWLLRRYPRAEIHQLRETYLSIYKGHLLGASGSDTPAQRAGGYSTPMDKGDL